MEINPKMFLPKAFSSVKTLWSNNNKMQTHASICRDEKEAEKLIS